MEILNTFVIPVLNNYKGLERFLETLYQHTPHNFRVIVVHNGKDCEEYEKVKDKVHLWINTYRNLGFAKSMNTGIRLADTPFITCANDDVELMYDSWWDEVMQLFKENPDMAGFNPHSPCNKQASGDRLCQYEYKKEYTEEDIKKMKEIFHSERFYDGCCTYFTIFKKELFDRIGLFDESFGQGSGEDYDICVRSGRKNSGKRICGGSKVMVWHWWGNTKDNMPVAEGGISNYDLIVGGNQNLERKWGKHIDKDPQGWSVSGKGGPEEPKDKDEGGYKEQGKWYQIKEL